MSRRSVTEPGDSAKAAGALWWATAEDYAHAALATGFVDVRQCSLTGQWRVRCLHPVDDSIIYLGAPEYDDFEEAAEMAVAISEELAK